MRNTTVSFMVIVATSLSLRCIPWAQNLTRAPKVPDWVAQYFDPGESVLVVPVWYDNGPCNIRGPVVILAGSLGELDDYLKPRWRLGVMGIDGHGPSHYRSITGFLLVAADGSIVWASHLWGIATGVLTTELRSDLSRALSTNGTIRPGDFPGSGEEPFFGSACRLRDIGTKLDADERRLVAGFFDQAATHGGS